MAEVNKKKYLFFFVHPSKYYLFRVTINYLKSNGHQVDIAIINKDVLEDLVKQEGWNYTNVFPEGRRSKRASKLFILFTTGINLLKTVFRLIKLTAKKKYDLFITDDCLSIVGWLRSTPVLIFTDDDIDVVPEMGLLYYFADGIIAPEPVKLGRFSKKHLAFKGYKELAYLHPEYFSPDRSILKTVNPDLKKFVLIRMVSLTASHDTNKKGLANEYVFKLIELLQKEYLIFISSERPLGEDLEKYRLKIPAQNISYLLYYADMLISDSQTMTSEAAVLGVPSLRFNDFVGKISVMEEKEIKYELTFGFKTNEFDRMLFKIKELVQMPDLKKEWQSRRLKMLDEMEDLNQFIVNQILRFK